MHFPAPSRDPAARRSTVARNDLFAAWPLSRRAAIPDRVDRARRLLAAG